MNLSAGGSDFHRVTQADAGGLQLLDLLGKVDSMDVRNQRFVSVTAEGAFAGVSERGVAVGVQARAGDIELAPDFGPREVIEQVDLPALVSGHEIYFEPELVVMDQNGR